jgi:hypothetical protein
MGHVTLAVELAATAGRVHGSLVLRMVVFAFVRQAARVGSQPRVVGRRSSIGSALAA